MDSTRQDIVVVWFKRDIRLIDHEPIMLAQEEKAPKPTHSFCVLF